MSNKREEGTRGEEKAISILKAEGYKILDKNFRSYFGEIDIIAEEGGYLVFIEVKKRNTPVYGTSLEAVNKEKKRHIIKSAMYYLRTNRCFDKKVRFDVVGFDGGKAKIVKHAFDIEQD